MLEISLLFFAILAIMVITRTYPENKVTVAPVPLVKNQFLGQLQHDVEAELTPRPTDCTLSRHYDALIKEKIEDRLCLMPKS